MNDLELELEVKKPRRLRFDWLVSVFVKPQKAFKEIVEEDHPVWLAPLLILSGLALILVLISAPIKTQAAAINGSTLPPDYQYYSPEQQQQMQDALSSSSGPIFTTFFPLVGSLAEIWIGWWLLGSILHLILTLGGSRSSNRAALNMTAWASMPLALRYIVQSIAVLTTHQLINGQGLSGLFGADVTGLTLFVKAIAGFIDIYFLWRVILMLVAVIPLANLSKARSWAATIFAIVLLLALQAVPQLLSASLGGLSSGSGMFFFF